MQNLNKVEVSIDYGNLIRSGIKIKKPYENFALLRAPFVFGNIRDKAAVFISKPNRRASFAPSYSLH